MAQHSLSAHSNIITRRKLTGHECITHQRINGVPRASYPEPLTKNPPNVTPLPYPGSKSALNTWYRARICREFPDTICNRKRVVPSKYSSGAYTRRYSAKEFRPRNVEGRPFHVGSCFRATMPNGLDLPTPSDLVSPAALYRSNYSRGCNVGVALWDHTFLVTVELVK